MTNVPHNYNSELKIDGIDGDNKLHEAIKNGNLLPELFANNYYLINIPNRSGLTPLDLAQKMGVSLTGVLLAAKVIMESKNQPADTISHNMNFLSSSILNQNPAKPATLSITGCDPLGIPFMEPTAEAMPLKLGPPNPVP
jgi:hypothetical protein